MNLSLYTRKDWIIIGVLLPPVIVLMNYWIFGNRYFTEAGVFWLSTAITSIVAIISWLLQIVVAVHLQRKYPRYSDTVKRLAIALSLYILLTSFTISIVFWAYDFVHFFNYQLDWGRLMWAIITGMVVDVLAASFHEAAAFYERWKKAAILTEQLKRENLQTQLESLKAQVNPHFLFNSLNSLSSLISEDSAKAEKFLDELSKVYRYLLRNNEDDLTTLSEELQFIRSYAHLLQTRYCESLQMLVNIHPKYHEHRLPPLTLQMLVENAVKHNRMMKECPLRIMLRTENGNLIVVNNLQRKVRQVSSNRVGLGNITKKYKLLGQPDIVVKETQKEFAVIIPLIAPSPVAHQQISPYSR
jgi:sensor histidine kinase YesM